MAQFTANAVYRFDPYKNFKFRIKWDGQYVAGLSKMTPLKRTTEVVKHREGGDPSTSHKAPGRTEYDAVTLSRGVTHDKAFEDWANLAFLHGAGPGAEMKLKSFRKDVILDIFDEAGTKVISYTIFRCWVSEYVAIPDLDSNANAVAIQSIKIECEGWERDDSVTEPTEQ
jgi:phage tail-like protein